MKILSKKISRRNFIKAALASGIVLGGNLIIGCENSTTSGTLSIKFLRQIITKDSTVSRCIMWQSDSPLTSPTLLIDVDGDLKNFPAQDVTFTDDDTEFIQYVAQVDGLKPNTEYTFKIVDGDKSAGDFTIRTFDENKFKGLIFTDSQSADYSTWGGVARAAFEKNSDVEFFINLGDIVDNGEDHNQWEAWMTQCEKLLQSMPFVPVMGNHECYSRDWQERYPTSYVNLFAVPENDDKFFDRRYYSFDFGAAHFAVLDSQWQELDTFAAGVLDAQIKWLREDLQATKKTWKIVCVHRDVLQYKINGRDDWLEGISEVGVNLMPEFDALNVDVVFTGHLHTYRNRGHLKNFVDNASGPLYILCGLSGDVRYNGLWVNHKLDKVIAPQPETDNYLMIKGDDKTLTIQCLLPDGQTIDEVKLSK